MEKRCFKCGEVKPIDSYYRHPQMLDGHLNKCIECTRKDVREHREKNLDRFREYDRERYRRFDYRKEQVNSLAEKRPRQVSAARTLGNAVKSGRVQKAEACWHCGATEQIEGHHVHYDLPLDVVWLCRSCHCKAHRETTLYEQRRIG